MVKQCLGLGCLAGVWRRGVPELEVWDEIAVSGGQSWMNSCGLHPGRLVKHDQAKGNGT